MDEQLAGTDLDRGFKVPGGENGSEDTPQLSFDDPTAIKANVLSNLLESLDAQGGNAGPVSTLLSEASENRY